MPRTARLLQLVGCRCAAFCQQHPPAAKSRDKLRLEKNVNSAVSIEARYDIYAVADGTSEHSFRLDRKHDRGCGVWWDARSVWNQVIG
jgi:hypothetical protein